MTIERFKHDPQEFVSVTAGKGDVVYIGVKDRAAFDRIALPLSDLGENERGHVLVKSLEDAGVMIVFQHWLKSLTIEAMIEDRQQKWRESVKRIDQEKAQ